MVEDVLKTSDMKFNDQSTLRSCSELNAEQSSSRSLDAGRQSRSNIHHPLETQKTLAAYQLAATFAPHQKVSAKQVARADATVKAVTACSTIRNLGIVTGINW